VSIVLAVAALPSSPLHAQGVPLDSSNPRARSAEKYGGKPQATQKLDDYVRKLNGEDSEERLEAIKGLGELADGEKKAVD
jgi:hypothetical protein